MHTKSIQGITNDGQGCVIGCGL